MTDYSINIEIDTSSRTIVVIGEVKLTKLVEWLKENLKDWERYSVKSKQYWNQTFVTQETKLPDYKTGETPNFIPYDKYTITQK